MSATTVDMAKVTQMLDAGWYVKLFKGEMKSYEVQARHPNSSKMKQLRDKLLKLMPKSKQLLDQVGMTDEEAVDYFHFNRGWLITDDFTPEQALTRMAYKVHGEIIP